MVVVTIILPLPQELVQFLFSLSTLHAGRVPFDLLAYAWALATQHGAAPRFKSGSVVGFIWKNAGLR